MAREITLGNGSTYIEKPSGQINIGRSEKKTAQQETPKKREKMTKDHQDLSPSNIKMNIIHLSDLHFGTLENASNWYSQLADDLKNKLNCSKLDIAILSGDIANKSTQKEYDAAEQFLKYLCQEFQLDTNHVVITPGNHDLNWSLSKKAYRIRRYEEYRGLLDEKGMPDSHYSIYKDKQDHIEVLNQENYKLRFKNFAKFYENIKKEILLLVYL